MTANQPKRSCFAFHVKPEAIAEYKHWHANVWPDMRQALSDCGFRNYSLFMRDDGMVFGYLESEDFVAANACMGEQDVNTRWQAAMKPFFASIPGDTWLEVFHLD